MVARVNISLPEELKAMVEEYNKENPYEKIIVSHVAQAALYDKLVEMGKV